MDGGYVHYLIKDFYLVKTDQNGDIEWAENYGADKDEYGTKVIQKNDGGYVLLGSSASFEEAQYKKTSIVKQNKKNQYNKDG